MLSALFSLPQTSYQRSRLSQEGAPNSASGASKQPKAGLVNGGPNHTLSAVLSNSHTSTVQYSAVPSNTSSPPAMCLATPYDPTGLKWTSTAPTATSLRRIRKFAASSAALITELILHHKEGEKGGQEEGEKEGRQREGQNGRKEGEERAPGSSGALWRSLFCTPLSATLDGALLLARPGMPHPDRLLFPAHKVLSSSGKGTAVGVRQRGPHSQVSLGSVFQEVGKSLHSVERGGGGGEDGDEDWGEDGGELASSLPGKSSSRKSSSENSIRDKISSERSEGDPLVVVGFDPLQSLMEMLRGEFEDSATILYDCHGATDAVGLIQKGPGRKGREGEGRGEKRVWTEVLNEMQTRCGDLISGAVSFE